MRPEIKHVLVAVDGSEAANRAAAFAGEVAHVAGAKLTLLYAYDRADISSLSLDITSVEHVAETERQRARDAFNAARLAIGDRPPRIFEHTAIGRPAELIVELGRATPVQLIVVGSRGRGRLTEVLLGSTAQAVLHHAPCAVTVVH